MKRLLNIVTVCGVIAAALAQNEPQPPRRDPAGRAAFWQNVEKLVAATRQLGNWDSQYQLMMDSVERVYARNGWSSEADQFSLSLVRDVNAIPPWSPQERFDKLVEALSDRYLLDPGQEQMLRRTLFRESVAIFATHSDRILQYAGEAIQTRVAGQPFTPEQVARWAQLAEPVFLDARQRVNSSAERLAAALEPEQQALLQADLAALNRRADGIDQMAERWARGEWQASDWGLENDPIQSGAAQAGKPGDAAAAAAAAAGEKLGAPGAPTPAGAAPVKAHGQAGAAAAEDNDPWAQYVRRFIQTYRLDDSQQASAWKIYRDVRSRAERYRKRFDEQSAAAARRKVPNVNGQATQPAASPAETELSAALGRLFDQLQRRLDRLPTRAQRRNAQPAPAEQKVPPPVAPTETGGP